ncbi:MAG TPA: YqgE/AlgH family protein [Burkholderiales bacterium]|nr:YqgE/AlgH family protein [Burkholderiales bacterium]
MGSQNMNLTHHFLIAMPTLKDPFFAKSLTYVCEHNEQGALGLVVNRPIDMTLGALFDQVGVEVDQAGLREVPVLFGGPVQMDRGFVLHRPLGTWQSTMEVDEDVGLTTSKDILVAAARGDGPRQMLVTLGYAGWAPGQLENEIAQNSWLTVRASPDVMFDLAAEDRLPAAMHLLGIDFASLSEDAGHA